MKKKNTATGSSVAKLQEKWKKNENKKAEEHQPMIQAMVWYKEEDYQTLLTIFDDRDQLPPTYEKWLSKAEKMKEEGEAAGDQVIKVYIDPETFPEWCRIKNLPLNAESRSQLAIEIVQSRTFQL